MRKGGVNMKKTVCSGILAIALLGAAVSASASEETVRVGSLKGPTSMGIAALMKGAGTEASEDADEAENLYEFTMVTAADELLGDIVNGELDIALVPANVAGILYNKTEGGVRAIDINTLGVLSVVENGGTVSSVEDLKGRTLFLTGKGTTPDYLIRYLLSEHGLTADDVKLEYKSEPTEVVSALDGDAAALGLLPQPFVTVAMMQTEGLRVALDLTKEWDAVQEDGSRLVTGVTVARTEFLEKHPEAVEQFLEDHEDSVEYLYSNQKEVAEWIAELGIVAKAAVAEKALPNCNITYIEGTEMKEALGGYLAVLEEMDPASVGGALPGEDFYYEDEE